MYQLVRVRVCVCVCVCVFTGPISMCVVRFLYMVTERV